MIPTNPNVMEMIQEHYQYDLKDPWNKIGLELFSIPFEEHLDFANRNLLVIESIDKSNEWRRMIYKRLKVIADCCTLFISELYKDNFTVQDISCFTDIGRTLIGLHFYIECTRILLVEALIKYSDFNDVESPELESLRNIWENWLHFYLEGYHTWWERGQGGFISSKMDDHLAKFHKLYASLIELERVTVFKDKDRCTELFLYTKAVLTSLAESESIFGHELISLAHTDDLDQSIVSVLRILFDFEPTLLISIMTAYASADSSYAKIDKRITKFMYFSEILENVIGGRDTECSVTNFSIN